MTYDSTYQNRNCLDNARQNLMMNESALTWKFESELLTLAENYCKPVISGLGYFPKSAQT